MIINVFQGSEIVHQFNGAIEADWLKRMNTPHFEGFASGELKYLLEGNNVKLVIGEKVYAEVSADMNYLKDPELIFLKARLDLLHLVIPQFLAFMKEVNRKLREQTEFIKKQTAAIKLSNDLRDLNLGQKIVGCA